MCYDTFLHGKLTPLCQPPALRRQSFFSSSNHFSLTQRHSERNKDPELPSCFCLPAQKSLTVCNTEVPLAAAFSGPVCTPPPSYFLCQSLSNIGTHSSHRRFSVREPDTILCTAIFFVIPHGGSVIFSTLLCLCGGFY